MRGARPSTPCHPTLAGPLCLLAALAGCPSSTNGAAGAPQDALPQTLAAPQPAVPTPQQRWALLERTLPPPTDPAATRAVAQQAEAAGHPADAWASYAALLVHAPQDPSVLDHAEGLWRTAAAGNQHQDALSLLQEALPRLADPRRQAEMHRLLARAWLEAPHWGVVRAGQTERNRWGPGRPIHTFQQDRAAAIHHLEVARALYALPALAKSHRTQRLNTSMELATALARFTWYDPEWRHFWSAEDALSVPSQVASPTDVGVPAFWHAELDQATPQGLPPGPDGKPVLPTRPLRYQPSLPDAARMKFVLHEVVQLDTSPGRRLAAQALLTQARFLHARDGVDRLQRLADAVVAGAHPYADAALPQRLRGLADDEVYGLVGTHLQVFRVPDDESVPKILRHVVERYPQVSEAWEARLMLGAFHLSRGQTQRALAPLEEVGNRTAERDRAHAERARAALAELALPRVVLEPAGPTLALHTRNAAWVRVDAWRVNTERWAADFLAAWKRNEDDLPPPDPRGVEVLLRQPEAVQRRLLAEQLTQYVRMPQPPAGAADAAGSTWVLSAPPGPPGAWLVVATPLASLGGGPRRMPGAWEEPDPNDPNDPGDLPDDEDETDGSRALAVLEVPGLRVVEPVGVAQRVALVVDARSGQAEPWAVVSLTEFWREGRGAARHPVLAQHEATADARGLVPLPPLSHPAVMSVRAGGHSSVLGISPLVPRRIPHDAAAASAHLLLATTRARAGTPVAAFLLGRARPGKDGVTLLPRKLELVLKDSRGRDLVRQAQATTHGAAAFSLDIPAHATPGMATLQVFVDGAPAQLSGDGLRILPPGLPDVEVELLTPPLMVAQHPVEVEVRARDGGGAPMAGAAARVKVLLPGVDGAAPRWVFEAANTLDARGHWRLRVDLPAAALAGVTDRRLWVRAEVEDARGQGWEVGREVPWGHWKTAPGLLLSRRVVAPGEEVEVEAWVTGASGPVTGHLQLMEVGPTGRAGAPVGPPLTLANLGGQRHVRKILKPPRTGHLRAVVWTSENGPGGPPRAGVDLYVLGPGPLPWEEAQGGSLRMVAERTRVRVGQKLRFVLLGGTPGGSVLWQVRRPRGATSLEVFNQAPGGRMVEVLMGEADLPEVRVVATMLSAGGLFEASAQIQVLSTTSPEEVDAKVLSIGGSGRADRRIRAVVKDTEDEGSIAWVVARWRPPGRARRLASEQWNTGGISVLVLPAVSMAVPPNPDRWGLVGRGLSLLLPLPSEQDPSPAARVSPARVQDPRTADLVTLETWASAFRGEAPLEIQDRPDPPQPGPLAAAYAGADGQATLSLPVDAFTQPLQVLALRRPRTVLDTVPQPAPPAAPALAAPAWCRPGDVMEMVVSPAHPPPPAAGAGRTGDAGPPAQWVVRLVHPQTGAVEAQLDAAHVGAGQAHFQLTVPLGWLGTRILRLVAQRGARATVVAQQPVLFLPVPALPYAVGHAQNTAEDTVGRVPLALPSTTLGAPRLVVGTSVAGAFVAGLAALNWEDGPVELRDAEVLAWRLALCSQAAHAVAADGLEQDVWAPVTTASGAAVCEPQKMAAWQAALEMRLQPDGTFAPWPQAPPTAATTAWVMLALTDARREGLGVAPALVREGERGLALWAAQRVRALNSGAPSLPDDGLLAWALARTDADARALLGALWNRREALTTEEIISLSLAMFVADPDEKRARQLLALAQTRAPGAAAADLQTRALWLRILDTLEPDSETTAAAAAAMLAQPARGDDAGLRMLGAALGAMASMLLDERGTEGKGRLGVHLSGSPWQEVAMGGDGEPVVRSWELPAWEAPGSVEVSWAGQGLMFAWLLGQRVEGGGSTDASLTRQVFRAQPVERAGGRGVVWVRVPLAPGVVLTAQDVLESELTLTSAQARTWLVEDPLPGGAVAVANGLDVTSSVPAWHAARTPQGRALVVGSAPGVPVVIRHRFTLTAAGLWNHPAATATPWPNPDVAPVASTAHAWQVGWR